MRQRRRRKQRAGEDPTVEIGGRARAERTRNMSLMIVTLDVSRLSGWLKDLAFCRAERKAYEASGMRAGGRGGYGAAAAHAACRGGPNCGDRGRAHEERTRNMSRMVVTLDVSKLSDWLNTDAPCRVEERTYKVGSMRAGMREGV